MGRYAPILIGIIIVGASAVFSYWYFFVRGAEVPEVPNTSPTPTVAVSIAPSPDFSEGNTVRETVAFDDGGFAREQLDVSSGGKIPVLTFQNNSSGDMMLEFEEKVEQAPLLGDFVIPGGTSADLNFIFPGRYVVIEKNSGSKLVVQTQ